MWMALLPLLRSESGGVRFDPNGQPALLHRGLQLAGLQSASVPANLTMLSAASAQFDTNSPVVLTSTAILDL